MVEFDADKSEGNKTKHGVGFGEAQSLWDDPDAVEVPVEVTGEPRYLVVGRIRGKHWSAIVTYRGDRTMIISVRRSRKEEVAIYESE